MIRAQVNTSTANRQLKNLTRRVSRLEPPLRKYGQYRVGQIERQFDTETDPYGNAWSPLAQSTIEQKRRLGYPDSILTRTGDLRKSFDFNARGKTLTIESYSPYAGFHQTGTRKMPARKLLPDDGDTEPNLKMLAKLLKAHFK